MPGSLRSRGSRVCRVCRYVINGARVSRISYGYGSHPEDGSCLEAWEVDAQGFLWFEGLYRVHGFRVYRVFKGSSPETFEKPWLYDPAGPCDLPTRKS